MIFPHCEALFTASAVCLHDMQTTNKPSFVHQGIPQDFLETGNSCEYLGIAGIPEEIQETAILNKVSELAAECIQTHKSCINWFTMVIKKS